MPAIKIDNLIFSYCGYGVFEILAGIMNIWLFGLIIYNAEKYEKKKLITAISFFVIIVLEFFSVVLFGGFIDYISGTGRVDTYVIISKIILMICMTFILALSCLVFIFAKIWQKEHPGYAVLRFMGDKKIRSGIKITRIDGKPVNSSKEIFSLWNKILITEGEHELTLREITRSIKSFKDFVIFEGRVKQNWLTEEYLIRVKSSTARCFEIIKVKRE